MGSWILCTKLSGSCEHGGYVAFRLAFVGILKSGVSAENYVSIRVSL